MKKIIVKDKKTRLNLKSTEKKHFILKSIIKNSNFFMLLRWKAFIKLKAPIYTKPASSTSNRCIKSVNKKRFNKRTLFSRHIYLKLLRSGKISGARKSSW
jgi:ribosomal protein S14